jgi:hypothetical protein
VRDGAAFSSPGERIHGIGSECERGRRGRSDTGRTVRLRRSRIGRPDERRPVGLPPLVLAPLAIVVLVSLRAWLAREASTPAERADPMPGDDLVGRPTTASTQAISIARPPEAVWPWLVQIGQGRAGFYSHAWLENTIGCRLENADRLLAAHQHLERGDPVPMHPRVPPFQVERCSSPHVLVLVWRPGRGRDGDAAASWSFVLHPLADGGATRLVARMRIDDHSRLLRWLLRLVMPPGHGIMERAMLRGLARRAERA